MLKRLVACLPLAAGGAVLTAATAGAAASTGAVAVLPIMGALLSGGAQHTFNKVLDASGDSLEALFSGQAGIDENHHILWSLRAAHLKALETVLKRFDDARRSDPDTARAAEAKRFSAELKTFLASATRALKNGAGPASDLEQEVFRTLPPAFDAALAARGENALDVSRARLVKLKSEIEEAVLAELCEATGTLAQELPASFRTAFCADTGWLDLFIRDAAARLKENSHFETILAAEQRARIEVQGAELLSAAARLEGKVDELSVAEADRHEEVQAEAERRHLEQLAKQQEILDTIAREKGVDPEHLRPVLARLGHQNVPVNDIPKLLSEAVDRLLARSEDLAPIHNDGALIDQAIAEARAKLKAADVEAALGILDQALETDTSYEKALEAEAEIIEHRRQMGRARARAHFEKAAMQSIVYDHQGAIASLEAGLNLDQDAFAKWIDLGDVFSTTGKTADALRAYEGAAAAAERSGDERDLSVSHERIGDVWVAQGDLGGALSSYEAGLAIAAKLAAGGPGNAGWQRDLSVWHEKIGNVRVAQGDLSGALSSYEAGLAIAAKLAAGDPGNAGWQRDLSVSHNKIGDVRVAQGDLGGALSSYEAGLSIRAKLAAGDPGNAAWQRDLSVSHNRIGDVRVAQGDLGGALSSFEAGLAIREQLAAGDPGNAGWQRDLSVSHEKIGNVRVAQGDLSGALSSYEAGLAIREKLAAGDPGNAGWQRDLSVSHNKIGDVLVAQGDLGGALSSFEAGLAIAEKLAAGDPGNAVWQRDVIVSCVKISEAAPDRAREHLSRALDIARKLEAAGKLAPRDAWMPEELERLLREAGGSTSS